MWAPISVIVSLCHSYFPNHFYYGLQPITNKKDCDVSLESLRPYLVTGKVVITLHAICYRRRVSS